MISTFGGFSMAKLGIRSSQQGLHITGNNITNINTNGYTRQRINQVSLYGGTADRYACSTDVRIGMGSLVTSVSQIRDPFLDIRYRNEASKVGFYEEKLNNLDALKAVLDEVSKDGVHTAFESIRTQLNNLANNATPENDTLVRDACNKLVSLLNSYSADLSAQKNNALQGFDQNVGKVNELLGNIQKLNIEIRKSQIHGDNALEMIDQRNMMIDELATMAKIKVSYSEEKVSSTISVNRLKIELDMPNAAPGDRLTLIDGEYANKLEITPLTNDGKPDPAHTGDYEINLGGLTNPQGDTPVIAAIRKELDDLNNQVNSLNGLNQKFEDLKTQRGQWNTDLTAINGQLGVTWNADSFGRDRETTLTTLKDAVKNAKDPAAKKTAQDQLNAFNKLDSRNRELNELQASLEKQRTRKVDALTDALQKQGLTMNQTTDADGKVTITVNGGNLAAPPNVTLVDPANPTTSPTFSVVDKSNNNPPADAELLLGGQQFKTVTQKDLNEAAHKEPGLYASGKMSGGVLRADLEYLNGQGEFGQPTSEIRGIAYYQRSLDTLAQTFAETMNDLNKPLELDQDGKPQLIDPNDPAKGYKRKDANLFESGDPNNTNITASNIQISKGWRDGSVHITQTIDPNAVQQGTKDNSNVHTLIAALNKDQNFIAVNANGDKITDPDPNGGPNVERKIFTGSFEQMFTNMNSVLGSEISTSSTLLNNFSIAANERAIARDNISSVDLNEEGINLVQYQKSFQAACRVMTTLDEMLQSILNIGVGG